MPKTDPILQQRARLLRHSATDAEQWLWQRLRSRQLAGHKFCRQVPVAGYIVDFLCKEKRLIVELDGSQHQSQEIYDQRRTATLEQQGYRVLRIWNNEIVQQGVAVLELILLELEKS